ncbi:hypothetical protein FKM82_015315 [Ascaphus truei]
MRLRPKPMNPISRGTTHSHVCCLFQTMQSLHRTSRGLGAPSSSSVVFPPAASSAAAGRTGGDVEAATSLILYSFHPPKYISDETLEHQHISRLPTRKGKQISIQCHR